MQEVDPDVIIPSDFGDLPEDLSEYMDDSYLNTDVLLGDPWFNSTDEFSDFPLPTEASSGDAHQQRHTTKLPDKAKRRKTQRAPSSPLCPDETPRPKRRKKAAGKTNTTEPESEPDSVQGPELSPVKTMRGPCTTPQRILHIYPSHPGSPIPIQFIALREAPGYQVVRLSPPPPLIRFPLPNTAAAPAYILVPASSPPSARQVPPLSPVDGAVAPVQMSSSPPGSLSDTASKAMSPPCASPLSPINDSSLCKESSPPPPPPPQSPTASPVPDLPPAVKEYIQEAKAHVGLMCRDMEEGLSLTSHYVDVKVNQRETLRSGKNTNKTLDKELVIMGDTDRQKSCVEPAQMFEASSGDKSRLYMLLLGNAGMGKTTLIKKLCLDWSRDAVPQFDFVFLLDGKSLTLTEPVYSLRTLLLSVSSFASSCPDPEEVYAQIAAAPKRVLIIFDGFDELRDYEVLLQTQEKELVASLQRDGRAQSFTVRQLYSALLQRILLPGCTLLLSTRPRGSASQLLRRADGFLEVCGFTPTHVETYLSQYFTDPVLRASALELLRSSSYLRLLCWNPGLCRLVCLVLEQSAGLEVLPRSLTGLCHEVLRLKMDKDGKRTETDAETQVPETEPQPEPFERSQVKTCHKQRFQRGRRTKLQETELDEVDEETSQRVGGAAERTEDRQLLSQLSALAWDGVKANSSILPKGPATSGKLQEFGLRMGLLLSHRLRTTRRTGGGERREVVEDHILLWANPFLQSYLAAVHLSLSRTISDRAFLQTLPFHAGAKARRRPQREELELTQRLTVGLLFHNRTELQTLQTLQTLHPTSCRDLLVSRQALVLKHMEGLNYGDLSPSQVLEACHYVYEASRVSGSARLVSHLAANLPELLTFGGVPLGPPDVFAVQHALDQARRDGRSFSLDLENSGIQICGLRALVGLSNISTYRACIADVISLWKQLEEDEGEVELLQGAVSKFKIHPLKATQVCHIEHLAKLVDIHVHKRITESSSRSESILVDGVPAVNELHKLEFELGPDLGPLALPKLWELLPGLHNLQHLDLENCKIGDEGAEKLADALVSLCSLEILNLSQNCIGDQGLSKLSSTLRDLPRLHCLSLYSNVISDEGAESLAAVLPHMASLTDLDVKYNKLTDVGAQSLGASLKNCKRIRSLRMWNQCIPYGVFERLQHQDARILWH
ncbi:MHC class II transactivator isoform X3 [Mugil cephalus]|nr:MHC class II transactivator isoform X3 [Mugil cephalus]